MELLHPAMWHDHDIDFARWLHPTMWHVALESWQWIHQVAAPCNVICGSRMTCQWIRPVAAPCNVTHSSGIMTLNSPGGSTLQCGRWLWDDNHGIRWNVCHIGILHLVSILTISPQSTYHYAPVCKILSKSDHPQQKNMTSCRLSRWRISAILDFRDPIMRSLISPSTTSYRSSMETITINCSFFEKIVFLQFGDRQTDRQSNRWTCLLHEAALCREQWLNKVCWLGEVWKI